MPAHRHVLLAASWLAVMPACSGDSTATSSGTATDGTTTGTGPLLLSEPEIVRYPSQPMVVDVIVDVAPNAQVEIDHTTDPGVRVAVRPDGTYRVRGLRPDTAHELELRAFNEGGDEDTRTLDFTAHPGLPGYTAAFPVTLGGTPEPLYRLFDLSSFGGPGGAVGAAMIDPQGVTRWYLGEELLEVNPLAGWAAVSLRSDGTMLSTRDDALVVADELGTDVVRITAEELGVPLFHHDGIELPNGNFLVLSVEFRDVTYAGDGELHVYGDLLLEVDPGGVVVWTWSTFDHLDPQRRRDGFDRGFPLMDPDTGEIGKDWTHGNGLVYRESDDSILLSLRHQDWIVSIDHATGEVNWRLGDEGDFSLVQGTWFFHQHSPQWQADGSLLLYDNGVGNPGLADPEEVSRAVIYALDTGAMSATETWQDDAEPFVAPVMGDADRLPGGNVLVLDSSLDFADGFTAIHARLRELDPQANPMEVWSIDTVPGRYIYRATAWDRLVGEPAP